MIRSSFLARLSLWALLVVAAFPLRSASAQDWRAQDVAVGPDAKSRVLWTHYGTANLWTVGTSGRVEAAYSKPFDDGWTTQAVTVGGDGKARLMSTQSDGRMELDVVSSTGALQAKQIYGPFPGWTAVDLACGRDNITRVLWRQNDGAIALWKVDNTRALVVQINVNHPALPGWTAQNIGVDPGGKVRLAWVGSNGRLRFWVTTPDLKLESSLDQGPFSGYMPFDLSLDAQKTGDGTSRIAWKNTGARLSLWKTDRAGKRASYTNFGPYPKFSPRAIALDPSGKTRVLWNHTSGGSDVRTVDADGSVASVSSYNYPPTNFVAKTNGKTVSLSWSGSANAQSYRIVRSRSGNSELKFFSTTRTIFADAMVEPGTTYYYSLSALTRDVESGYVAASVGIPVPATGGSVYLAVSPAPSSDGTEHNYLGPFVASDGTGTKGFANNVTTYALTATRPGQRFAEVPGEVRIKLSKSGFIRAGDKFILGSDDASVYAYDRVTLNYYRSFGSQAGPKTGTIEVTAVSGTSISLRLTNVYMKGPLGIDRLDGGDGATGAFYFNGTFVALHLTAPLPAPTATPTALPTATPIPVPTITPAPGPSEGKIAFVSLSASTPGIQEIWVMNANGSNRTQLTTDGIYSKSEPRWNRDGTKLVFSGTVPEANPNAPSNPSQIFTINADGSGFVHLTKSSDSNVSDRGGRWNPDGSKIVFHRATFTSFGGTTSQIYVMNADGSKPVNYTAKFLDDFGNPSSNYAPEWSPEGSKILFQHQYGDTGGLPGLATVSANGTAPTIISRLYCADPQWSPDGRKIVSDISVPHPYVSGNTTEIFVMNADGSGALDITPNGAYNYDPRWSPDGNRIVIRVITGTGGDIFVLGADGSGAVNITHNPMYSYNGDSQEWSPSGNKIVFHTSGDLSSGGDILVAGADGSGQINLTNNQSEDSQPQWTIGSVSSPPPVSLRGTPSKTPSAGSS